MDTDYPALAHFVAAYLNQDWDIVDGTLEGVMDAYNQENPDAVIAGLRADIDRFLRDHQVDADRAFDQRYGQHFEPAPDARSFLEWVLTLLKE